MMATERLRKSLWPQTVRSIRTARHGVGWVLMLRIWMAMDTRRFSSLTFLNKPTRYGITTAMVLLTISPMNQGCEESVYLSAVSARDFLTTTTVALWDCLS